MGSGRAETFLVLTHSIGCNNRKRLLFAIARDVANSDQRIATPLI